jgi:hypothetical protein
VDDLGPPTSYLELSKGLQCYSCDGEALGKVDEVRAAPDQDIFDGIVIDTGEGRRFIEAAHVEEIFERGVLLRIDRAAAQTLPAPER